MYLSLQGNVGLGKAIEYFTSKAIPVSIPLNDTQKYDLIVDIDNKLYRISVKTSTQVNEHGSYVVQLRNCGGSSGKSKVRLFDNTSCDYIFVLTSNNKTYLIPSNIIAAINSIVIGKKYIEYEVISTTLDNFIENMER
jgi:hypothetical protein